MLNYFLLINIFTLGASDGINVSHSYDWSWELSNVSKIHIEILLKNFGSKNVLAKVESLIENRNFGQK